MILVHRLTGESLFLNADLIETIEAAPDTIVTLVDGRRILLKEDPQAVVTAVSRFRAAVIVTADELRIAERPSLRLLPDLEG